MFRRLARLALAVPLAAALALTSACSGGGSDPARPSAAEIAKALTEGAELVDGTEFPQEMADCWGAVLHDSALSDEALRALVDDDENYEPTAQDTGVLTDAFTAGIEECGTPGAE